MELEHHHQNGGSTSIPWITSQDNQLSFIARGLLQYALSLPPRWDFSAERIAAESPHEGKKAILNGLRELEAAGYRRVFRVRGEGGRFATKVQFAFRPVAEWIEEFEAKQETKKVHSRRPMSAGAKKSAQASADNARAIKLGKQIKPQVAPEVNQPDSGPLESGESSKTPGRTGSQPTELRSVESLRVPPTERTTHTPASPVTDNSSVVDVDGVCVSEDEIKTVTDRVIETVPTSSRKYVRATGRARIAVSVRDCLTRGHVPDVIVAEADTATREGTTHPVNLVCKTLSELQELDPATVVPQVTPGASETPEQASAACVSCGVQSNVDQFDAKGLCPECVANGYGMFFAEVA